MTLATRRCLSGSLRSLICCGLVVAFGASDAAAQGNVLVPECFIPLPPRSQQGQSFVTSQGQLNHGGSGTFVGHPLNLRMPTYNIRTVPGPSAPGAQVDLDTQTALVVSIECPAVLTTYITPSGKPIPIRYEIATKTAVPTQQDFDARLDTYRADFIKELMKTMDDKVVALAINEKQVRDAVAAVSGELSAEVRAEHNRLLSEAIKGTAYAQMLDELTKLKLTLETLQAKLEAKLKEPGR